MNTGSRTKLAPISATPVNWGELRGNDFTAGIPPLCISFVQYAEIPQASVIYDLRLDGESDLVAYAVKTTGRLRTSIRFTMSSRNPPVSHSFWNALVEFAKHEGATSIHFEILSDDECDIPTITNETERQQAIAFILDLSVPNSISSNHRRNIKKAEKNDVRMIELGMPDAVESHLMVCQDSGQRRRSRGEFVAYLPDQEQVKQLLNGSQSARIYQAAVNDRVVSSMIVVFIGRYAFFDSAGSSPEGMKIGSSHYLMNEVINQLREANVRALNLGLGTASRAGLIKYKEGFGAARYHCETVSIDSSSYSRGMAIKIIEYIQSLRK